MPRNRFSLILVGESAKNFFPPAQNPHLPQANADFGQEEKSRRRVLSLTRKQTRGSRKLVFDDDGVGGFAVNATKVVERGTCTLGGNHAGTNGFFRGTGSAEDFTFPRLDAPS